MSIDMDTMLDPRRSDKRQHEGDVGMLIDMKVGGGSVSFLIEWFTLFVLRTHTEVVCLL